MRLGLARAGNPCAGAHRRHLADRARGDAAHAAAHPRDHARVALSTADERLGPRDAHHRAHRHRRRNPRRGADQAWRAPGAHAGAPGGERRAARAAHRPVRDAEAHRGGRAVPGRRRGQSCRRSGIPGHATAGRRSTLASPGVPARHLVPGTPHRQLGPRPRTRHQPRHAGGAARGGHVGRSLGHGLRPAREAHRRAPHHAGVREHAPHGRARVAPSRRAARRRPPSPRTTAVSRRKPASTPSSASRPARSRSWWPRRRSSSASTSATWSSCASSARRAASPCSCSASAAPTTPSSGVPKGRIFPGSRDELIDCVALLDSVRRGELDRLHIPEHPLDVLSQQIVAEVSAREYGEDELFELVRSAYSYRNLSRKDFDAVVRMLAEGIDTKRGRRGTYLHRDAVNRVLRARKGARLTAITCGGAIPDNADYQVILEPAGIFVGTLNEDFAIESLAGDVFQLGNTSYQILRVEAGRVRVEDAKGQPPSIPFWLGEAPARTDELSASVSRLRADIEALLPAGHRRDPSRAPSTSSIERYHLPRPAAHQMVEYLAARESRARQTTDARHAGVRALLRRIRRAAAHHPRAVRRARQPRLRTLACARNSAARSTSSCRPRPPKTPSSCRSAKRTASSSQSVARFLNSKTVEDTLIQAMLDSPMFTARWRWNASISLAIRRNMGGKRTPPQIQRMASEDLIAVLFPDQIACAENLSGPREIPDHPLVKQTLHDCLHEAMDIDGLRESAGRPRDGHDQGGRARICSSRRRSPRKSSPRGPTPTSTMRPLEERRTLAVTQRRWLDPETRRPTSASSIPRRSPTVREQAWPEVTNADELHDAMHAMGVITEQEGSSAGWTRHLDELIDARRATRLRTASACLLGVRRMPAADPGRVSRQGRLDPPVIDRPPRRPRRSGSARRRSPISCAAGCRAVGPHHRARHGRNARTCASRKSTSRSSSSKAKASCCAAASREEASDGRGRAARRRHARMVRAPTARAHPPLHHQDAARGNRARVAARTSCASCSTGRASRARPKPEGVESLAAVIVAARGLRSSGRRLGERRAGRASQ